MNVTVLLLQIECDSRSAEVLTLIHHADPNGLGWVSLKYQFFLNRYLIYAYETCFSTLYETK